MKIVNFWRERKIRLGLLLDNEVLEPALADSLKPGEQTFFSDTISFIRGGELALSAARRLVAFRPAHTAFDTSAPIGPCITTADEIPDPQVLGIHTRVNGERRQSSNTRNMIWSCADLIHFFSTNFTLKPGMIIITGTPAGTAWSADKELGGHWQPKEGLIAATRYFLPGDTVECEIERIGVLRNPVR